MATLPTLRPNGNGSTQNWLINNFENIDEGIASANDSDTVHSGTGNPNDTEFLITDVPGDFGSMDSMSITIRARSNDLNDDTLILSAAIRTSTGVVLAGASSFGAQVVRSGTPATFPATFANYTVNFTHVDGSASASDWNNAILLLRRGHNQNMGSDGAQIVVSALDINGEYTAGGAEATTADVSHGLVLGHSATANVTVDAEASHGLALGHAATIDVIEDATTATVDHGLILGHSAAVDLSIDVAVDHGLVLGHSASVDVTEPSTTVSINHNLSLGHAASISSTVEAEASHGLVLGHSASVDVTEPGGGSGGHIDFVGTAAAGIAANKAAPSVVAPSADALLLACAWYVWASATLSPPGGMTAGTNTIDSSESMRQAWEELLSSGATGTRTASGGGNVRFSAISVVASADSDITVEEEVVGHSAAGTLQLTTAAGTPAGAWLLAIQAPWSPSGSVTPPSGGDWELIADLGATENSNRILAWAKQLDSGGATSVTFTNPTSFAEGARLLVLSADAGEPGAGTVSVAHGLLLGHSATVEKAATTAEVSHGLVLGHSASIGGTIEAEVSHGLTLGHDAEANLSIGAEVAHGLTLGHDASIDAIVEASAHHGLVLGHSAVAEVGPTQATVEHGLTLGHAGEVTAELSGAVVSHGLVLGHSANIEIPTVAEVSHGLTLGESLTANVVVRFEAHHGLVLGQQAQAALKVAAGVTHGLALGHSAVAAVPPKVDVAHGLVLGHAATLRQGEPVDITVTVGTARVRERLLVDPSRVGSATAEGGTRVRERVEAAGSRLGWDVDNTRTERG